MNELGFVPFERAGGELLFNILAQRYERRSTIITTNLAFSEWEDTCYTRLHPQNEPQKNPLKSAAA